MIHAAPINPIVEHQLAQFEAALQRSPGTNFTDYFLAQDHDDYQQVALELMRVDLELAWQRGRHKKLSDYQALVPELFDNADLRSDLAFEEFRTRVDHGEAVDAAEYETNYSVDTTRWKWTPLDASTRDRNELAGTPGGIPSSPAEFPAVGDDWGDFHVVDELGRGSLARTYLAQQRSLSDRLVALKISHTFTTESDKLARLQHTNIVPVYSIHHDGQCSVTCMPFLGRTTLADLVARPELLAEVDRVQGPSTREQSVLRLVLALAGGLQHAHARGILHRDIKPANILLSDEGEPMLLDFNLAIDFDESQTAQVAGGTVPYMAPEQLRALQGGGFVDERSDVYSLGVVLYQLLTGRLPWNVVPVDIDNDLAEILAERERVDLAELKTFSPSVVEILRHCLDPTVEARYQSAGELATDLAAHLADEPLKFGRNVSLSERVGKWVRRHPRLCSLTSAAVILAVGAVTMAAAWTVREQQVAGVRATEHLLTIDEQLASLRPAFSTVALYPEKRDRLRSAADELARMAFFGRDGKVTVEESLSSDQLETWHKRRAELAYLRAHLELLAAVQEPDEDKRAQLCSQALRWNQLAAEVDESTAAVRLQRSAIDAVNNGQRESHELPAIHATVSQNSATDCVLMGLSLLFEHHQPELAIEQLRRAVELAPTEPSTWLLLVEAYLAEEEFSQAEACADLALALMPDSPLPQFGRGVARLRSGQHQPAADDFQAVLELDPDNHRARMNLALALKSLGNAEEALAQLDIAIARGFEDPRALFIRSRLRASLGDAPGAREDVQIGLSMPAIDAEGWLAQGIARVVQDPPSALSDFAQCLRLSPRCAAGWHNMAHVQSEKMGDSAAAIESLGEAIRLNPDDTMALAGRGVLHARTGNRDQALRDARQLRRLPLDAITEYQLGCIYALLAPSSPELAAQAVEVLASSLRHDPALADSMVDDPDLTAVQDSAEFQALVGATNQLRNAAQPETE